MDGLLSGVMGDWFSRRAWQEQTGQTRTDTLGPDKLAQAWCRAPCVLDNGVTQHVALDNDDGRMHSLTRHGRLAAFAKDVAAIAVVA
jgi:hypothetical protein